MVDGNQFVVPSDGIYMLHVYGGRVGLLSNMTATIYSGEMASLEAEF